MKLLSEKELFGFKSVSKSVKSAIMGEKGMIGERLKEIIKEGQFRSVPNMHKFKVKNWGKFSPRDEVEYIVKNAKKYVFVVCDGDLFKVGVNIEKAKNLGTNMFVYTSERSKGKCSIGIVEHP